MSSVSVIVPVYKSEATLYELHDRLTVALGGLSNVYEIIFIDDGSPDDSWNVIKKLSTDDSDHVRGLRHGKNYGQHNALLTGIRSARFDVIVTLDDDLQNPPEEISKLLEKLENGYDVVYGIPAEEKHGFLRDTASRVVKFALQNAMGVKSARSVSAFRAFRKSLCRAFADYRHPNVIIDVLLSWTTNSFGNVVVRHEKREKGTSNYSISRLMSHALNMVVGYSVIPLRIASYLGFFFTFFGVLVFLYVIGRYILLGGSVAGFPFLASIIAIFSGVQLFVLGILGEYIARIHIRNMDQPISYVIERTGLTSLPPS